jgi:hypothetical protein
VGLVFDALWHGLLNPHFEAVTIDQMVRHLSTVHLPIYVGAVSVVTTTAWALVDQMRRSKSGLALPIALSEGRLSRWQERYCTHTLISS